MAISGFYNISKEEIDAMVDESEVLQDLISHGLITEKPSAKPVYRKRTMQDMLETVADYNCASLFESLEAEKITIENLKYRREAQ